MLSLSERTEEPPLSPRVFKLIIKSAPKTLRLYKSLFQNTNPLLFSSLYQNRDPTEFTPTYLMSINSRVSLTHASDIHGSLTTY